MVDAVDPAQVDLSVQLAGIPLSNPVMVASGTFGSGKEYAEFMDISRLGAIVCKGVSAEPMEGNPPPRVCETPSGMLNAIGLQNPGVHAFAADDLQYMRELGIPVIVNVLGGSPEGYAEVIGVLEEHEGVAAYELNISCPNVEEGGIAFGCHPPSAHAVVAAARERSSRPLIAKLTPNVTDVTEVARACVEAGVDALSLINTVKGMVIDVSTRRPALANVTGGLSGPAIRPVAVRMVFEVARAVEVPVIGMGEIASADDAMQFLLAGATAVAVGTSSFTDPSSALQVIDGLRSVLAEQGATSVREVIGGLDLD